MPRHRGTGDRIIGILKPLARVWSMCRQPEVAEFMGNGNKNAPWDAAIAGNAALREAFLPVLDEDPAHILSIDI
eukprot:8030874-Pyramimonas_sp.AAC.1